MGGGRGLLPIMEEETLHYVKDQVFDLLHFLIFLCCIELRFFNLKLFFYIL